MRNEHQWEQRTRGFGRRFVCGAAAALSLTLVAFEWKMPKSNVVQIGELTITDPIFDEVPRVKIKKVVEKAPATEEPKPKKASGPIKAVDKPVQMDLAPIAIPMPEPAPPEPVKPEAPPIADNSNNSTGKMLPPILNPEILPHFSTCLNGETKKTNQCTEQRIQRHLERYLSIPESVIGSVATTVTFEIDAHGRIGRLICAPKVDPEVEKEIDRVIRSLPEFIPGTQGGHPVPVYYQIPLRLRRG